MDEVQVSQMAYACSHLRFKFQGVYAADTFPPLMKLNTFAIVNTSPRTHPGTHWVLLARNRASPTSIIFGDPLGYPLSKYNLIYRRITAHENRRHCPQQSVITIRCGPPGGRGASTPGVPLQPMTSSACGLYCLYMGHFAFNDKYIKTRCTDGQHQLTLLVVPYILPFDLHRFIKHMT